MPVVVSARVLKVDRRNYYRWVNDPFTHREVDDEKLLREITKLHLINPGDGYRLITHELVKRGFMVGKNRVHKICQHHQIHAHFHKKAPISKKSLPPACNDLIKRDFTAEKLNQKWVIDLTEHPTCQGKVYTCALKDLSSHLIVATQSSSHPNTDLVLGAVIKAVQKRKPQPGLIIHSDRGIQFQSQRYRTYLAKHHIKQSMGNAGTSADNASIESFFALLQKNVLNLHKTWKTRNELIHAINHWITNDYNQRRPQQTLGNHSPQEYEKIKQATKNVA